MRPRAGLLVSPFTALGDLTYSLFTSQLNVALMPDVFGWYRRPVESRQAPEQQTGFALAASHFAPSY
jgi:hypothetical protein